MNTLRTKDLVYSIKDKCRVCYTCVRECPVKAIQIMNGQADIISERCIACGHCVDVCSQGAKAYKVLTDDVEALLNSDEFVIACVAPSFPAEFDTIDNHKLVVGMIRKLGFDKVVEVGFGADIIADKYTELLSDNNESYISSDCPAVVAYIEQYKEEAISALAPVDSPLGATAKILKNKFEDKNPKLVFIGPCIAKKAENKNVDVSITFKELQDLLAANEIFSDTVEESEFDEPLANKGAAFPVSGGLLENMGKYSSVTDTDIIVTGGKENFKEVVEEYIKGDLPARHIELLCCQGCIMGPGMSKKGGRFIKRNRLTKYLKNKMEKVDVENWENEKKTYIELDFSKEFEARPIADNTPDEEEIQDVLSKLGKKTKSDHLDCGACGYPSCREHAIAIIKGLAEDEMCLPYTIETMNDTIDNLNVSNEKLANAKEALKQSEKLAHMGQLSAGIAHELNNPLGVITMYCNILKDETDKDNPIYEDLNLIVEQADRCKNIVGGLLNFARKKQVRLNKVNIIDYIKNSTNSIIKGSNITINTIFNIDNPNISIDEDQMAQVFTNLYKNAIEAMPDGGELKIEVEDKNDNVIFKVSDSGTGIEPEVINKIFTPFFTTKSMGKGTGMGLPLVYGIIKMHRGKIKVESNTDKNKGKTGTSFIITLPRKPEIKNKNK